MNAFFSYKYLNIFLRKNVNREQLYSSSSHMGKVSNLLFHLHRTNGQGFITFQKVSGSLWNYSVIIMIFFCSEVSDFHRYCLLLISKQIQVSLDIRGGYKFGIFKYQCKNFNLFLQYAKRVFFNALFVVSPYFQILELSHPQMQNCK